MAARENPPRGDDHGDGPRSRRVRDEDLDKLLGEREGAGEPREREPRAPAPDESDYAPVPLGGPDLGDNVDDDERGVPAPPPEGGRSAASVRASMRPKDPWRRPAKEAEPSGHGRSPLPALGRFSVAARAVTVAALLAAVAGVLIVAGPIDLGGAPNSDPAAALAQERERSRDLQRELRRESGQRYAWEMWAREFDARRYRTLKRRAERRSANIDTGG